MLKSQSFVTWDLSPFWAYSVEVTLELPGQNTGKKCKGGISSDNYLLKWYLTKRKSKTNNFFIVF